MGSAGFSDVVLKFSLKLRIPAGDLRFLHQLVQCQCSKLLITHLVYWHKAINFKNSNCLI